MSRPPAAIAAAVPVTAGDPAERLTALYNAHEDRLYRLARRLADSVEDAHDLVQETFLRAAKSLRVVPIGATKEEAWLVRVLVNIRRDQWRRAAVRRRAAVILRGDVASETIRVEPAIMARRAVWAALDVLQPRRRAIVIMHELDGLTPEAIAAILGVARMTVQWHLSMGRRDLRRVLAPQMGDIR